MPPSYLCPLLTSFSLPPEGHLGLRSQSCGTCDARWIARSHVFDARGPVEVERAGRGRDEDSQETLDQVKGRWRRELGGALVTVVKRKTKFTGSFSFIILRKRANLLLPFLFALPNRHESRRRRSIFFRLVSRKRKFW